MKMNSVLFTSVVFLIGSNGQDCNGCDDTSNCVKLNDNIYGCYGTFSSGTISSDANNLCGENYHICKSANEASVLGLTSSMCSNIVPSGHSFWTLESSNGNNECYSYHGAVTDDRPSEDVWGCFGDNYNSISINGCTIGTSGADCDPFNIVCGDTVNDYSSYGFNFCQSANCEGIELFVMQSIDDSKSGSLCCTDDLGIDLTNVQCDESIIVRSIVQGSQTELNFEPYVGTYHYSGLDSLNQPKYVHSASGASFGITSYLNYENLISFNIPSYQGYWTGIGGNELIESETQVGLYFMQSNDIFNGAENIFYSRGGPPVTIKAVFNDCPNYGFEKYSANLCSMYDETSYDTCNNDEHCQTCESWGCTQCETGYYKMGDIQRCQKCGDAYVGCATCENWQGCTACQSGYSLTWVAACDDHVCKK